MSDPVIVLCSVFDEIHCVTCDLPQWHKGPHKATVLFGDEGEADDER